MKQQLKRLARAFGVHLFTDDSLPTGVDWLLDIRRLLRRRETVPRVFFDVGANLGQTALEIRKTFPATKVYAFEPIRSTYENLRRQTAHEPALECFPLALGAAPGSLEIPVEENSVYNTLVPGAAPAPAGSSTQTVEIETLDRFCEARGIMGFDVLKTDTEGYDLEVLRGGERLLAAASIGFVYAEITFVNGNRQNTAFLPLYEHLTQRGYQFLGAYETWAMHYATEAKSYANVLFVNPAWLERAGQREKGF